MSKKGREPCILIVDANALFRQAVKEMVSRHVTGLHVLEAAGQRDAIHALEDHRPALVLLDKDLDEGRGLGLTRRIRRRYPDIEVALMSLDDSEEYARQALAHGAGYFLSKAAPSGGQILAAVRHALEKAFPRKNTVR